MYRFLQATAHAGRHHSRRATASSIYSSDPHNRKSAPIASCCSAPRPPGEGPGGEPGQCRTTPGEEGPPEAPQGLQAHGGRDGRRALGTCLDTKPVARLARSGAQPSAGLAVHTRYSRPWRPTVASTRDRTPAGALTDAPNDERPDNDRLLVHERLEPAEEAHGRERPVGPWSWFG